MITNSGSKWDSKLETCLKKFSLAEKPSKYSNNDINDRFNTKKITQFK